MSPFPPSAPLFQVRTFPCRNDYIQTSEQGSFSSLYQNGSFITRGSASWLFSSNTILGDSPSYRLLHLFLARFSEVWTYICKGSREPNFGEEFKTCLSDSEKPRCPALEGSGLPDSIPTKGPFLFVKSGPFRPSGALLGGGDIRSVTPG